MRNTVGTPVRGKDLFNREVLIEKTWEDLEAGNNVFLVAPRRFGKTSIMYHLIDHPREGWKAIHVDAESIREPVNFVIAILDAFMADKKLRSFLVATWKKGGGWIRKTFEEVELTSPWQVGAKIKLKEKIGPHWEERGSALLESVCKYDGKEKLLIVIDELPVMLSLFRDNGVDDAETRTFLYWFRKLRTDPTVGMSNCRFVLGGSIGIEGHLSRLGAIDTFNDFQRVFVGELGEEQARGFLGALLKGRKLDLSAATRRKIMELVGIPIPYFIQVFVSQIVEDKALNGGRIGPQRVETIYNRRVLGSVCKTYFQHYYDRLRRYDKPKEQAAKALLKELALAFPDSIPRDNLRSRFRKEIGAGGSDEEFVLLIDELENDFYIRYREEEEAYVFGSKILCDWWRRYYAF